MDSITYKSFGTKIVFDDIGITVTPFFFTTYTINWEFIEFISPVPLYIKVDDIWVRKKSSFSDDSAGEYLEKKHILSLEMVVRDYHIIPIYGGRKRMFGADDTFDGDRGYWELGIKTNRLSASTSHLFDLLSRHAKFDLICHF